MTKTIQEKERFIILRAQGLSFDRIAEELQVSKPTLIKWQGELNEEVKAQEYFELENLLQQYALMRRNRFEAHSRLLNAIFQELQERTEQQELSELSVSELLKLALQLEQRLSQDTEKPLLTVRVPDSFEMNFDSRKERIEL